MELCTVYKAFRNANQCGQTLSWQHLFLCFFGHFMSIFNSLVFCHTISSTCMMSIYSSSKMGACVLMRPPGRSVQGHSNWCTPPHSNSLYARVMAISNTNRPRSTEAGALCQDSMLHCWTRTDHATFWCYYYSDVIIIISYYYHVHYIE